MVDQLDGVQLKPEQVTLGNVFSPPTWLRHLGRTSWLLVGFMLVVGGLIWLVGATYTIVGPVLAATIVGVVAMPIVDRLDRHMPRGLASALILIAIIVIAVVIVLLVYGGISDQRGEITSQLSSAQQKGQSWLHDLGISRSGSQGAGNTVKHDSAATLSTLVHGVLNGIRGLASLLFGLSFAALSLFFILKDGPMMREWIDGHLGLPLPVARTISDNLSRSLRGYFRGVTIIALFNAVVVGLGALLLGLPLVGTIAIVCFVTAYVPYVGAFVAGVFVFFVALGAGGTSKAIAMLVIFLLANGLLQNIAQPFAMGAALDLNPLVVLIVTIGAGCLFGGVGLVLAAPVLSAATHIMRDLRRAAAAET